MKRIHYLLLGLLVSLTIAAVSPSLPPTRIVAGSGIAVITNGVNSFTISGSAPASLTNVLINMQTNVGIIYTPASGVGMQDNNASPYYRISAATTAFELASTSLQGWSSTGAAGGTKDVGLARSSAGILEVNNGISFGAYRDLYTRNLYSTLTYSLYVSSVNKLVMGNISGVELASDYNLRWSSTTAATVTKDAGLGRTSAGLLEVNTGTNGTLRDLAARSLYATNLYATNLVIGGGATVTGVLTGTATLDFDLTAVVVQDETISVTGAAVGDVVILGAAAGSYTTTVEYTAWVGSADLVNVRARTAAVGENPTSGTFRATIIKH